MTKYIAPKFLSHSFTCPYCKSVSTMTWKELMLHQEIHPLITGGPLNSFSGFMSAICHNHICCRRTIWLVTKEGNISEESNVTCIRPVEAEMIHPVFGLAPPPAEDMPESAKIDYNEAALIFKLSPRSASALLRLCLQKLCIHLGCKGKKIDDDLAELAKKEILPNKIIKAADVVRITGNNAVHPGTINDEDFDNIAIKLFDLINIIVHQGITETKEINELFNKMPDGSRQAAENRGNSKA